MATNNPSVLQLFPSRVIIGHVSGDRSKPVMMSAEFYRALAQTYAAIGGANASPNSGDAFEEIIANQFGMMGQNPVIDDIVLQRGEPQQASEALFQMGPVEIPAEMVFQSPNYATITGAETLTNKTLTSPVINNPTGTMTLSSGTLGYATGNGGTVTQTTSKATGVTLDKICGSITMDAANLVAGTSVSFVMTNSTIAAADRIILNHISGGTFMAYAIDAQPGAGSATVGVRNLTTGDLAEAVVIGFAVIKAATA